MVLNAYKYHHSEALFIFTTFVSLSRPRSIYVVSGLRMLHSIYVIFCQFDPGVAYKSFAYKKTCRCLFITNKGRRALLKSGVQKWSNVIDK